MKKFLLALALVGIASTASAQHYNYRHHHGHRGGGNVWLPLVGGAIAGAVIYDMYNRPIAVQQPPVVVQQPPVIVNQPTPVYTNPTVVYDCVDVFKPSSVPGNEHIVRTCTQRVQ